MTVGMALLCQSRANVLETVAVTLPSQSCADVSIMVAMALPCQSCVVISETVAMALPRQSWYNVIPKNNKMPSSVPANGIYHYEQCVKGIDPRPSPPEVRRNAYEVGEPVWVKPQDCQCTTRFCEGPVDGVISRQTMLVNSTACHVKDLRRCQKSAVMEEDESDTLSGSEMGVMVTCESKGQHSFAQLTSENGTKNEDDQANGDGGNAGNPTEEHPTLP